MPLLAQNAGADCRALTPPPVPCKRRARAPAGFLFVRVLRLGKDDRFDDRRESFWRFLVFWVFQMVWVWTVSLPVTVLNAFPWGDPALAAAPFGLATDIVGTILFVLGFFIEAGAFVRLRAHGLALHLERARLTCRAAAALVVVRQSRTSKRTASRTGPRTRAPSAPPASGGTRGTPTTPV